MAKQPRRWIPRSVKLVPAAMVSAIMLAIMSLLGWLNFNLGIPSISTTETLTSDVPSEYEQSADPVPGDADSSAGVPEEASIEEDGESSQQAANPTELVDVLIVGDEYRLALQRPDGESIRESRTLEEIVELARELPGDDAGVRARISRRFNATARADRTLLEALLAAGLTEDEIDHRRTLVD